HSAARTWVLIEGEHVAPAPQKRFGVAAATAGAIDNERTRAGGKQLHHFPLEHWTVINVILHFVRLLFDKQRIGGEPDRPLMHQCVHSVESNYPLTNQLHSRRADKSVFPPHAPVSNVANSKSQNVRGHRRGRPRLSIQY